MSTKQVNTPGPAKLYTTGDFAHACQVSAGCVRLWKQSGKIVPTATTVGRRPIDLYAEDVVERTREERGA
jgi:DNA-binding transcriptional MerR regulator